MALPDTFPSQGASIAFGTQTYTANVLSFSPLDGAEVPSKDVTHLGTTGARQMKPGKLTNYGTLSMTVQFDGVKPVMGVAETITITYVTGASPDPTIIGTGFVSGFSVDSTQGDEGESEASLTITWDGDTPPAFSG